MPATPPREMLETMANLAETHHEHEKFYSQSPLRLAAETQTRARQGSFSWRASRSQPRSASSSGT
ncbi:MAG: hypothetical protein K0R41_2254 [Geminicoccaceae bacterium]|nr:hypothetical protein [Geminicoccaceae bacterium]